MDNHNFRHLVRTDSEETLFGLISVENIDELFDDKGKGPTQVPVKSPAPAKTSEPQHDPVSRPKNPCSRNFNSKKSMMQFR